MVETADAGSVTEAAKRLSLSPAGQRLVNDARLLLNHARDFAQSAQSLGNTLYGEIASQTMRGMHSPSAACSRRGQ